MKNLKYIMASAFAVLALIACEEKKQEETLSPAAAAVPDFNGQFKTGLMKFETDQCGIKLAMAKNSAEFVVNELTVACVSGGTEGLYVPIRLFIAPRGQFKPDDLAAVGGPPTSQILALGSDLDRLEPRGWIDQSDVNNQQIAIKLERWDVQLFNQLELSGRLLPDGRFESSRLALRDGWSISEAIPMVRGVAAAGEFLYGQSPWRKLKLPAGAKVATGPENQNFLYCVDRKDPLNQGIVDLKGARYSIGGGTIGEMGFINRGGENRVFMFRTDSGSKTVAGGFTQYGLSTTGVGGKTGGFRIAYTADGYGYLSSSNDYERSLCRLLQNDVFQGLIGWNP